MPDMIISSPPGTMDTKNIKYLYADKFLILNAGLRDDRDLNVTSKTTNLSTCKKTFDSCPFAFRAHINAGHIQIPVIPKSSILN